MLVDHFSDIYNSVVNDPNKKIILISSTSNMQFPTGRFDIENVEINQERGTATILDTTSNGKYIVDILDINTIFFKDI